jgi:structure-specific endonuclease subunit SLX1
LASPYADDRVMHTLLCSPPFSSLPLHVRCFTEHAYAILDTLPPTHLEHNVGVILDLGGVSGSTGQRRQSTSGATARHGPIDVQDSDFRGEAWDHWVAIRETVEPVCSICSGHFNPTVSPMSPVCELTKSGLCRLRGLFQCVVRTHMSYRLLRSAIRRSSVLGAN